jgi:hypothetical protein
VKFNTSSKFDKYEDDDAREKDDCDTDEQDQITITSQNE